MSSREESYYDIYLFAPDKRIAVTRILENLLLEIKQTLIKQNVSSYEAHGNVLILYHSEWVKFTEMLNSRERRAVLRPDGLFRAFSVLFPIELPIIRDSNPNVAKLMAAMHINVNS
jgi:hypothetical protein